MTHDPWVLDVVKGLKIPFVENPIQIKEPFPYRLSQQEKVAADLEIDKLLQKQVLEIVQDSEGQVISNIFLRPKKDGNFRMILDLTWVNKHVEYQHFKMCSLQTAKDLLRSDCWMGSLDLKDAYYSVLIDPEDRKFLRFRWKGVLYQFRAMPNGLACAPRYFTKILNPIFAKLRSQGHETFQYIDDSLVLADSLDACKQSLHKLCVLMESLGFVIHPEKSVFEPTKNLVFLGYDLNSETMQVKLTPDKVEKFIRAANDLLGKDLPKIREVAGLVGLMNAYSQAFDYALAHMKALENDKIQALKQSKGMFDVPMKISQQGRQDIFWWLQNISRSCKHVSLSDVDFDLYTDASESGWGAHCRGAATGGRWNEEEASLHINVLELKAILFGLKSFCKQDRLHVRVFTDNTTALAYVKHMGGVRSELCNEVAKDIWDWCEEYSIWITIAHIPGALNVIADYKSRKFSDNVEWSLHPSLFAKICLIFGQPEIDLFATRLNTKLPRYVSFKPDPHAEFIDAFSLCWTDWKFYAFPPFSCIARCIAKALRENATGLLVVPWWPSQPWWATLINLGLRQIKFRVKKNNLLPIGKPNNVEFLNRCPLGVFLFSPNSY